MSVVEKVVDTAEARGNVHMAEYLRKENYYKELREEAEALGYGIGSIVSERTGSSMLPALVPHNWGIVQAHCAYKHNENDYRTLEICWIRKGKQNTFHFVEDLYLVYPAVARDELELEFQIQDEEFRRGEK